MSLIAHAMRLKNAREDGGGARPYHHVKLDFFYKKINKAFI
jgi:hypothetical protein